MYKNSAEPSAPLVEASTQYTVISADNVMVIDDVPAVRAEPYSRYQPPRNDDIPPHDIVVEGPSPIRRNKLWIERWTWPKYATVWDYVGLFISTMIIFGLYAVTMYFFLTMVIFDADGNRKPFKGACFSEKDMRDHLCFFSAGQFAFGILCLGQVNIGLFCLGQVSIGIALAIGQVASGWGYSPIGQFASGFYTHFAQIAFCLYDFDGAQIGFRTLRCFLENENGEERTLKSC